MYRKNVGPHPRGAQDDPQNAVKELFVPVQGVDNGGLLQQYNMHSVATLAITHRGFLEFYVPKDFSRIIDLVIVLISGFTSGAVDLDIHAQFGSLGELSLQHQEGDTTSTYALTNDVISELDLSTLLADIWRGDYVGIRIINSDAAGSIHVLGVRFRYL